MADRKLEAFITGLVLLLGALSLAFICLSDDDSMLVALLLAKLYRAKGEVGFGVELILCSYMECVLTKFSTNSVDFLTLEFP